MLIVCKNCGLEKDHSLYYKSNKSRCKECVKESVRSNRLKNIEKYREYDRKRGARQDVDYLSNYRNKFPKKYSAHNKVNNHLRDGKIIKPKNCEECNSDFHIEAHHDDYDKPLCIRWLCAACHKQWHAIHGEALNAT